MKNKDFVKCPHCGKTHYESELCTRLRDNPMKEFVHTHCPACKKPFKYKTELVFNSRKITEGDCHE